MTGRLIKYDLKSMLRTMLPLWIALVVVSVLFGVRLLFISPGSDSVFMNGEENITIILLTLLLFGVFVAVFVLNIIVVIQRFWHGLLKDEGYLMFTLPVSTRSLIISKALSAMIIYTISTIVAAVCVIVIVGFGYTAARHHMSFFWFVELWQQIWKDLRGAWGGKLPALIGWAVYWFIAGIVELLENIYHAYTAMAIGQLSNKNRFISSIIAYLALSFAVSMAVSFPMISLNLGGSAAGFGVSWFSSSGDQLFAPAMFVSLGINILLVAAYHIVTEFLLTKNLNLE